MSVSDTTEQARVKQMLRELKVGTRVRGNIRSPRYGNRGRVVDPRPFESDGVRRIKVRWDDGPETHVLPSTIEVLS